MQRGSWGWISRGRQEKGCCQLWGEHDGTRGATAAGEPQRQGKPHRALELGSWLAQRGGTKSWPWEEGEDGIETLHRQRLAMPGRAVGQTHDVLARAELQRTPHLSQRSVNVDPSGFVSASVLGAVSQLVKLRGTGFTHLYVLL